MEKLYKSLFNRTHRKILCVGRNYADHAKEMKVKVPTNPIFFDKPLSSIIRSGETLHLQRNHEIHHELELGILIGMTGMNILARDWYAYVEGYFLGIDFTDRDMQNLAK